MLADLYAARERIADRVYRTPCVHSEYLSDLLGARTFLKLENLQFTGSFKARGAYNKLLQLTPSERQRGIICASAGNHAQAVAYYGRALQIAVKVVMPRWAPLVKVSNCRNFGASVLLHGESFDDARAHAQQLAGADGHIYVPGFDDPHVIAGAGTLGLELLEDVPDMDAVIVPAGGGGLLAGTVIAMRSQPRPIEIYAIESFNAPTLGASLEAGRVVKVPTNPSLADGLAVAEFGSQCFQIVRHELAGLELVDEAQIASAILRLLEVEKTLVEGAGAVALAGALKIREQLAGKTIVLALGGGNIDVTVLSRIIDRGLRVDGRLCKIVARISDRPGGLANLLAVIAGAGASILEVYHDRHFGPADVARITVSCVLETQGPDHIAAVHKALLDAGVDASLDE
ncbi:MAG: threonine ammonia-lyase [Burkholderiales bacterium]|nr:threonine ammonia-lyase [Phycisphaerae bacterium]